MTTTLMSAVMPGKASAASRKKGTQETVVADHTFPSRSFGTPGHRVMPGEGSEASRGKGIQDR